MPRRRAIRDDPLTPDQRRLNMSRIRATDTKLELVIRRGLHAEGLRFRLHDRRLPGTPDLVFASARVVVLIHGCFWHGHDCALGVQPRSNAAFWDAKIGRNQERDQLATDVLVASGWRVATVWECALRGRSRLPTGSVLDVLTRFVRADHHLRSVEITGASESGLGACERNR
jgi:DNA mismatch endonuclease (patch repair protein)